MATVYYVATNKQEAWQGLAPSARDAVEYARRNFLCPFRSIARVERRVLLPKRERATVLYDARRHGVFAADTLDAND